MFGGPGDGETTLLARLTNMCDEAVQPLLCSAMTGVSAGSLKRGVTVHSSYIIPVCRKRNTVSKSFLKLLSEARIRNHLDLLNEPILSGMSLAAFVDEISMISAVVLGQVSTALPRT